MAWRRELGAKTSVSSESSTENAALDSLWAKTLFCRSISLEAITGDFDQFFGKLFRSHTILR